MNIIARLEFEPAYYDFVVHHFNHYTTKTPHLACEDKSQDFAWEEKGKTKTKQNKKQGTVEYDNDIYHSWSPWNILKESVKENGGTRDERKKWDVHTTLQLRSARISRRFQERWEDLLSLGIQYKSLVTTQIIAGPSWLGLKNAPTASLEKG